MTPTNACVCKKCTDGCRQRPGWFRPGEAEQAAELLGVTLSKLFQAKLAVDAWVGSEGGLPETFVLAPALVTATPGQEYPFNPTGRCVFLTEEDRCQIHVAKPYECAVAHHVNTAEVEHAARRGVVEAWQSYQGQIRELLGREPQTIEPESFLDGFALLFQGFREW